MPTNKRVILTSTPPQIQNKYHTRLLLLRLYGTRCGFVLVGASAGFAVNNGFISTGIFCLAYFLLTWIDERPWPWTFRKDEAKGARTLRNVADALSATLLLLASVLVNVGMGTWSQDSWPDRMGNLIFGVGTVFVGCYFFITNWSVAGQIIRPKTRPATGDELFDSLDDD